MDHEGDAHFQLFGHWARNGQIAKSQFVTEYAIYFPAYVSIKLVTEACMHKQLAQDCQGHHTKSAMQAQTSLRQNWWTTASHTTCSLVNQKSMPLLLKHNTELKKNTQCVKISSKYELATAQQLQQLLLLHFPVSAVLEALQKVAETGTTSKWTKKNSLIHYKNNAKYKTKNSRLPVQKQCRVLHKKVIYWYLLISNTVFHVWELPKRCYINFWCKHRCMTSNKTIYFKVKMISENTNSSNKFFS